MYVSDRLFEFIIYFFALASFSFNRMICHCHVLIHPWYIIIYKCHSTNKYLCMNIHHIYKTGTQQLTKYIMCACKKNRLLNSSWDLFLGVMFFIFVRTKDWVKEMQKRKWLKSKTTIAERRLNGMECTTSGMHHIYTIFPKIIVISYGIFVCDVLQGREVGDIFLIFVHGFEYENSGEKARACDTYTAATLFYT